MSLKPENFEYFEVNLDAVIRFFIDHGLKRKNWEVLAVDDMKRLIVLRRWKKEGEDEEVRPS